VTKGGRSFQTRVAATENARSQMVRKLVDGTPSSAAEPERSQCRDSMSATRRRSVSKTVEPSYAGSGRSRQWRFYGGGLIGL